MAWGGSPVFMFHDPCVVQSGEEAGVSVASCRGEITHLEIKRTEVKSTEIKHTEVTHHGPHTGRSPAMESNTGPRVTLSLIMAV